MCNRAVEILLVENNPGDEQLTLLAFKRHHLTNKIFVVRDGAEALDYIFGTGKYTDRDTNCHPKVILLDLKMPKVDGLEVLRRIKADPKTKRIPVVVLTSSSEESDIVESYELGANSYIVKPVDFKQFTDSIREIGMYWLLLNEPLSQ
jgi:two-component system response regulator